MLPRIHLFGGFSITPYGIAIALAFIAALWLTVRLAHRRGIEKALVMDVSFYIIIAAIVGARLYFVLQHWGAPYMHTFGQALMIWDGGLVFYGGFLGGLIAVLIYVKVKKVSLLAFMDILAPATALGYAITRIGCFLNGCCYGAPTNLPWGVVYPPDAPVYSEPNSVAYMMQGTPVHPVQLYATIINAILCLFLIWMLGRAKQTGTTAFWYFLIYPVYRFGAEMIRGDNAFQAVQFGLTIPQWTAVILTVWALLVAWAVHVAGRRGLNRDHAAWLGLATTPIGAWVYALAGKAQPSKTD
jgi:phosphatidylglycerol:prolipoprotein diacylglycerol transferase